MKRIIANILFVLFVALLVSGLGGMLYGVIIRDIGVCLFWQIFAIGSLLLGRIAVFLR